jgi:hypothetical protein
MPASTLLAPGNTGACPVRVILDRAAGPACYFDVRFDLKAARLPLKADIAAPAKVMRDIVRLRCLLESTRPVGA